MLWGTAVLSSPSSWLTINITGCLLNPVYLTFDGQLNFFLNLSLGS